MTFPRQRIRRATAIGGLAAIVLAGAADTTGIPAMAAPVGSGSDPGSVTVDTDVVDEISADGTTSFWVYLDAQPDLDPAARIAGRTEQGRFVYDELTSTARASQADLVALLDDAHAEYEKFWIANAVRVTGGPDLLDEITALPGVAEITADHVYELPDLATEQTEAAAVESNGDGVEWGIEAIGASDVWDTFGVTGEDIVVGSIDSGVQFDHPALVRQYRGTNADGTFDHDYHWWDPAGVCGNPSLAPCDNYGHGTHTTGTMVGDDGTNHVGVAPGAHWIAAKGCELDFCSQASLLSAGQFMLAPTDLAGNNPDPSRRPHVVNNSWGNAEAGADPWFQETVDAWVAAGIFPVFSGGNAGPACGTDGNPGNMSQAYAAGAFDADGQIASFSSRGPSSWDEAEVKPNIAAPGVAVRSTFPGGRFTTNNGTSMAAPHVAGAVALIWSAAPEVERDVAATRALLDGAAVDVEDLTCGGTAAKNNVWGEGKLDVYAAVDAAPRTSGEIAGTVTDAQTEAPVDGASVTMTGPVTRIRTTGDDGTFAARVPAGVYDVTVRAFGYQDQAAQVTVVDGETTELPTTLTEVTGPGLEISPSSRIFGVVPAATTTDPVSVTLTSFGSDPVTVTGLTGLTDGFAHAGGTCGTMPFTLGRWDTCTLDFTARPLETTAVSATVDVVSDAEFGSRSVSLTATGTTLPARTEAIELMAGESNIESAVIDPDGRYAYYGTSSLPGEVVKVDLETFERVDVITLPTLESVHRSAVIDPEGRYAYFGTASSPARVVKIDLATFERVDVLTLSSGENNLRSAIMDPSGEYAYFGTDTSPGRVVKIDLATFTRVGAASLGEGNNSIKAAAIDPDGAFAYFGGGTLPSRIVKVDLEAFAPVGVVTFGPTETTLSTVSVDPAGSFVYVGLAAPQGRVVKIDADTFTRVSEVTFERSEHVAGSAVIDPDGRFAYFGTQSAPGRVVKVDLATFERVDGITLRSGERILRTALMSDDGNAVYFSTFTNPAQVVKVQVDADFTATATPYRERGAHQVALTWDGSFTSETDVVRDGVVVATVPNTGSYTDTIAVDGIPRYTYRLCDAGTQRCSEDVVADFRG